MGQIGRDFCTFSKACDRKSSKNKLHIYDELESIFQYFDIDILCKDHVHTRGYHESSSHLLGNQMF